MSENDWKRFVDERRAAARIEREILRANPPTTEQAVAACLEMLRLYESLHGDPFVKDAVTLRKEEEAREAWTRLRERWPGER